MGKICACLLAAKAVRARSCWLVLPGDPRGDLGAIPRQCWCWHTAAPRLPLSLPCELAGYRIVGLESLCGGLRLRDSCFLADFGIGAFPHLLQAVMGGVLGNL